MEMRLARHGRHIAVVTIDNQPLLNAMTRGMLSELGRLWDELERDGDCRCIILTGAGQRAFTVGADVTGDLSAGPEVARMVNHALLKNDPYSKPIVAAVNGDCVGRRRPRIDALDPHPRCCAGGAFWPPAPPRGCSQRSTPRPRNAPKPSLYTSGSTAAPKGVTLAHGPLIAA